MSQPWKKLEAAIKQAKTIKSTPTDKQKLLFDDLINKWLELRGGLDTTNEIIQLANQLSLHIDKNPDYIMLYTKKGVRDYNGPLLMLRLGEADDIMIMSPHNCSDSTNIDTVVGFLESKALVYICNGNKRAREQPERNNNDFIRNKKSLGFFVVANICDKIKGLTVFHIHGSKKPNVCLVKCRNNRLEQSFKKSITDHTSIETFKAFNAGYVIDKVVNTDYYLKTEIPSVTHLHNKKIIANIINEWTQRKALV